MTLCRKQKGVAIIMVLLIVAIATSLAAYMAMQQDLWQRQVESQFERAQARQLGLAGIDWARSVLAQDKLTDMASNNNIDHEKEIWNLRLPAIPVEAGEVIGAIEDRQGLYNLNNVAKNVAQFQQFQRLLAVLGLPASLAPALADWIDADTEPQAGGAEDGYYLALPQPYRAANRPLVELGELTKVKGFDSRTIESLRAFVSVLPAQNGATPINVNFAPAEVLVAVIEGLSLSDARLLVQQRQNQPFKDTTDFKQRVLLLHGGITVKDSDIAVKSDFFWVTGRSSVGKSQVVTQVLMQRIDPWPKVVWQSVQ
jgi:general secretion pathway protein K